MKTISAKDNVPLSTNCGGTNELFRVCEKVVEDADVNGSYPHYLGHGRTSYRMTQADVGRHISVVSQPSGYVSWSFIN
jgi:hypothetical protein